MPRSTTPDRGRSTPRRRWKLAIFRLAALTLAFLAVTIVAEVGVTLVLGPQIRLPRRVVGAPHGLRINQPGVTYRQRARDFDVEVRINSQGLRADRDVALAKPAGVRRILALGDSYTMGYGVPVEGTFSAVLERELRARGHEVEVINAGVGGFSNAEALLWYERDLHRMEPDVVLLSFYENDLEDNERSGLFALEDGKLVARGETYVPAGRVADALNRSEVFNALSERSNAFSILKRNVTELGKSLILARNQPDAGTAASDLGSSEATRSRRERLAAAILARLDEAVAAHGARLLVQVIPPRFGTRVEPMADMFPDEAVRALRPSLAVVHAAPWLAPHAKTDVLFHGPESGSHWSDTSHRVAGERLAEWIDRAGWLEGGRVP